LNWRAAAWAGITAGVLSTVVEIALWAMFTDALPEIFLRDARFAAAIVMGRDVLSVSAGADWQILGVATLVHFTLSVGYTMVIARLASGLRTFPAFVVGAPCGALLYGCNLYGFTAIFPWFEASRNWITAAAHVAFGVAAVGAYRLLERGAAMGRGR
jgi:uncharacterized membrane protein YagU involved in acid resistance